MGNIYINKYNALYNIYIQMKPKTYINIYIKYINTYKTPIYLESTDEDSQKV